jgi:hypothetical protein
MAYEALQVRHSETHDELTERSLMDNAHGELIFRFLMDIAHVLV